MAGDGVLFGRIRRGYRGYRRLKKAAERLPGMKKAAGKKGPSARTLPRAAAVLPVKLAAKKPAKKTGRKRAARILKKILFTPR